jgi:hypothetical protein
MRVKRHIVLLLAAKVCRFTKLPKIL